MTTWPSNRSGVEAMRGVEPPVPVGLVEQPVLEVAPGDEANVAQCPLGDRLAQVLVEGIETDVEVDRADQARGGGETNQIGRLGCGHGQRLLAHDMTSRGEDLSGLRHVQVVRRRDVHDLHALVGQERLERRVGLPDAEGGRALGATLRAAAEDAANVDPDATERLDMDRPDEAGADDGGADGGGHPRCYPSR